MKATIALSTLLLLTSCASTPSQHFSAVNQFTIDVPTGANQVEAWFALPDDREELQDVRNLAWKVAADDIVRWQAEPVRDSIGNRYLHFVAAGAAGTKIVVDTTFDVDRREARVSVDPARTRPLSAAETTQYASYLAPSTHMSATPAISGDARRVVGDEKNPILQARILYDWVLGHVQYWVKDPSIWKASSVGSATYCYEQCTGNCTDFHSLYVAAAHSVGLPARMVYGSFFKGPLDGVKKDQSYHCWVEFYAPNIGWVPLDVAVADVFVDDFTLTEANAPGVSLTVADGYDGPDQRMVDYYFGNLDARRVTWNRGRDLVLEGAKANPVNAMPKAHIEVDGKPLATTAWSRILTFEEK